MKTKLFYLLMCLFAFTTITNAQINSVAIVGDGIEVGGWPGGALNNGLKDKYQLTQVGSTSVWTITGLVMVGGPVKFRANNAWLTPGNWGAPATGSSFPGPATAVDGSNTNIAAVAGTYDVSFDVATGIYSFSGGAPIPVVTLFGTATDPSTGIQMNTTDGIIYTLGTTTLLAGNAQFSVDGSTVGALAFPSGTATGVATDFIPVPAGKYSSITYDNSTLTYTFVAAPIFPKVAIVGDGAGGWPPFVGDDPNQMKTTDGITYTFDKLFVIPGSIVFRQDNAWSPKWDGASFPTGPSLTLTGDIIVPTGTVPGTYNVTLNTTSGAYTFTKLTYSIVGDGVGGWPPFVGNDPNQLSSVDGINYTINNLVVVNGGAKFRVNNAWAGGDWGGDGFTSGTKTGNNIPTVAGTYNLTVNVLTGAYDFGTALAVKNFSALSFKTYPNPTQNSWTISSGSDAITSVQVFDILGKSVYVKTASSNDVSVNASNLSKGTYFAKVSTANGSSTVKLIKD